MFWDRLKKRKNRGYNWEDYYSAWSSEESKGKNPHAPNNFYWGEENKIPKKRFGRKFMLIVMVLLVLVVARNWQNPYAKEMREGLSYVLTTEWNFQPTMEKAVQLGLQLVGAENEFDSPIPREMAYQQTMGELQDGFVIPASGKVVKEYGWQEDSLDGMERFHSGIDIEANFEEMVKAVSAGEIIKLDYSEELGNYIQIDHGNGVYSLYAGVEFLTLTKGQLVEAGENIAKIAPSSEGNKGILHFEYRENYELIDPLTKLKSDDLILEGE